jgi:hypothetical protein
MVIINTFSRFGKTRFDKKATSLDPLIHAPVRATILVCPIALQSNGIDNIAMKCYSATKLATNSGVT